MAGHFSSLLGAAEPGPRVPVTVLTGFLGSGKTTLLNRLLALPDLRGTAVIINEFGAVGIDHDLVATPTQESILLANGCLCCAVRGDLVDALVSLAERAAGEGGQPLSQVLIETSGLADPGPILRTVMGEPALRDRFCLAGVACTVDAVLGAATLDAHPESVQQVAVADHLLLTKTDLAGAGPDALTERLRALNALAPLADAATDGVAVLRELMSGARASHVAAAESAREGLHYRPLSAPDATPAVHRDGITSCVLVRDEPLPLDALSSWLDMVIAARGSDLLRVKGLVCLDDDPDAPLVIHGVQHLFPAPHRLPAWPSADRRTRIVFITRGVDVASLGETLDILVRRHARRRSS